MLSSAFVLTAGFAWRFQNTNNWTFTCSFVPADPAFLRSTLRPQVHILGVKSIDQSVIPALFSKKKKNHFVSCPGFMSRNVSLLDPGAGYKNQVNSTGPQSASLRKLSYTFPAEKR